MTNSWRRNILADHPLRAESSGQGEEVSGEVGMIRRAVGSGAGVVGTGIAAAKEVGSVFEIGVEGCGIGVEWHTRPMGSQYPLALRVFFNLPDTG